MDRGEEGSANASRVEAAAAGTRRLLPPLLAGFMSKTYA
jgi:hypothetical protein